MLNRARPARQSETSNSPLRKRSEATGIHNFKGDRYMDLRSRKSARRIMRPALLSMAFLSAVAGGTLLSQMGGMAQSGALQEKLAALKASTAENQQKLHQYTWTETTQLTLNGEPKP